MASQFQPPPTYAEVVIYDKKATDATELLASAKFNPIWLKWFLDLVKGLTAAGGGSGSVTSFAFTNANGISGSVANATTNPTLSLALGNITPGSVTASGAVTGTNLTAWTAFTTTRTGWTDVGAPTVTGRYCQVRNVIFFAIKVMPGTTVATVAGTSYCSLPVAAGANAIGGEAVMNDLTTLISTGAAVIDTANSRVYVPTKTATGDTLTIYGSYEV